MNSKYINSNPTSVTVGTSLTTLITEDVNDRNALGMKLENLGATAFNAFEVQVTFGADDEFETIASASADFTSPSGILIGASGDLTALGATSDGWFMLDVSYITQVRVQASVASGSTTATAEGIKKRV